MYTNLDLTLILDTLTIAADHLVQLRRYSEDNRANGRGLSLSSPYSDGMADRLLAEAIDALTFARPVGAGHYHQNVRANLAEQIASYETR